MGKVGGCACFRFSPFAPSFRHPERPLSARGICSCAGISSQPSALSKDITGVSLSGERPIRSHEPCQRRHNASWPSSQNAKIAKMLQSGVREADNISKPSVLTLGNGLFLSPESR